MAVRVVLEVPVVQAFQQDQMVATEELAQMPGMQTQPLIPLWLLATVVLVPQLLGEEVAVAVPVVPQVTLVHPVPEVTRVMVVQERHRQ